MTSANVELDMNLVETIETVISSLDEFDNVLVRREDGGHLWKFTYGSADIWVQLTGVQEEDILSIWSPILPLPVPEQDKLFRKLMSLNWLQTLEAHFATIQNQIVVLTSRSIEDLSVSEISHLITLVATLADDYDDLLDQEFGGKV